MIPFFILCTSHKYFVHRLLRRTLLRSGHYSPFETALAIYKQLHALLNFSIATYICKNIKNGRATTKRAAQYRNQ